jgi:eukaryotic-like serine/threonine-protein kinase
VYQIAAMIGAGGMGEVYQARDTRLLRDVAIKVLPTGLIDDADRRARFEREAHLLASLNHAGIATIHGVEESEGHLALVMELVEGPTLAERIGAGPLSIGEAIPIARQICDALEYAHERGVIHRDLKPANIKVRPDGAVKLLDFGLAKALDPGRESDVGQGFSPANATHSPTLSLAGTRAGVILGTAGYMAPEQARGSPVDRRADIWSFGCVVSEMLTGKQVFSGDTVSDTLAAILRAEPEWKLLPPETPVSIRRLLKRCLEKDSKRRLQHIGDARLELEDAGEPVQTPGPVTRRIRTVWAIAGGTVIGAATVGALWAALPARSAPPPIVRFRIPVPARANIGESIIVSPDGRTVVTGPGPSAMLFKRRLDGLAFEPIRGTEGGFRPFFSPDSAWIAFFSEGKLKKVPIEGGVAVTICDALRGQGTWSDDGSIVFALGNALYRVASTGGVPQPIINVTDKEGPLMQPVFLPGSGAMLVRAGTPGRAGGRILAVDLRTRARHVLVDGNSPQLAATGDLLFEREGGIWAVGFDAAGLTTVGTPVRVVDSVRAFGAQAVFSVSRDGSLVHVSGDADPDATMVWIDRTGKPTPAIGTRADYQSPRLSPDGTRVVVSIPSASGSDLWVYEFERGTRLRLTTAGSNRRGVWSPDGARMAFYATRAGADQNLFVMPASGGEAKILLDRPASQFPDAWSPDGRVLVFDEGGSTRDLWLLPAGGKPQPLLVTSFNERGAALSPDGRLLAFVTDESGRDEVYVQAFPGPGGKTAVSTDGGIQPMWSRNGRELFYREGDSMMAVGVSAQPFRVTAARKLFEFNTLSYSADPNFADYDVAPDGRFVAIRHDRTGTDDVHVVLNWSEELRRARTR